MEVIFICVDLQNEFKVSDAVIMKGSRIEVLELVLKVTKSQEVFSFPTHLQKIKLQSINCLSQMRIYLSLQILIFLSGTKMKIPSVN